MWRHVGHLLVLWRQILGGGGGGGGGAQVVPHNSLHINHNLTTAERSNNRVDLGVV